MDRIDSLNKLQPALLFMGLLTQVIGYVFYIRDAFEEPKTCLYVTAVGYVLFVDRNVDARSAVRLQQGRRQSPFAQAPTRGGLGESKPTVHRLRR